MKYIIFIVLLIFFTSLVSAIEIFINPNQLYFTNTIGAGYTKNSIIVQTDAIEQAQIIISSPESLSSWFVFEPEDSFASKDSPSEFTVIVEPPLNAVPGSYETYLTITVIPENNNSYAKTSAIAVKTTINVTPGEIKVKGKEIRQQEAVIPLSINFWAISVWVVILVFVTWTISKNEKRE